MGWSLKIIKTPDPIAGQNQRRGHDEFRKKTVEEYSMNGSSFSKFPLRHYRQLEVSFDVGRTGELLRRLQLPTGITALVFGGYTGQFANTLRDLGMKVIFTDPIEEWVTKARESGFEAYCHSAEELPSNLLDRCQLAATFECYFPFGSESVYSTLRLLTREYGLLFAESKQTRKELQAESASGGMIFLFLPYYKVYSIKRVRREKGDLRLYHYRASNPGAREMMLTDAQIMKASHDNLPNESTLTLKVLLSVPSISAMGEDCVDRALRRITEIHFLSLSDSMKFLLWTSGIWIGTKRFRLDETRLAELNSSTRDFENNWEAINQEPHPENTK